MEIELQPLPIEERPAPALPPSRANNQSSTARSSHSTTQPSTIQPSAGHYSPARDSQGYLLPVNEQTGSRAESGSPESSRCSGVYSYAYQHMVARIMEFRMLQCRGRLGVNSAQIHRQNQRQRPPARRPSSDPTSRFWNVQDSSGSTRDSSASVRENLETSASTRLFPANMSDSRSDSDYQEHVGTETDDTRQGPVYERIDDREIVMMVTNV